MAVSKKTVGGSKKPKPAKSASSKVAATKITTGKIHTTLVITY